MDRLYFEANNLLKEKYTDWITELRSKYDYLCGEDYSNPYYASIPKGWYESKVRILIVGEEGHGNWGCGKGEGILPENIDYIQSWNWRYLSSNTMPYETMNYELYPVQEMEKRNPGAFWRRIRKLSEHGTCAWTNIDKIHIRGKKCALSVEDRTKLHSLDSRILVNEIRILKPTHVVLFGWYGISLKHELPDLYELLYPNGPDDNSVWKCNVVHNKVDGIEYIATYHPNWGCKHAVYEEKVMNTFIMSINSK